MYPKYRRMLSSYNRAQRITTYVPTPQFKKWDNSNPLKTFPLYPSPIVWYSFPAELTTTLTCIAHFLAFLFSIPMYICIPKHYVFWFWKPSSKHKPSCVRKKTLLLFNEGPKSRSAEPSIWEKSGFRFLEVILGKLVDKVICEFEGKTFPTFRTSDGAIVYGQVLNAQQEDGKGLHFLLFSFLGRVSNSRE